MNHIVKRDSEGYYYWCDYDPNANSITPIVGTRKKTKVKIRPKPTKEERSKRKRVYPRADIIRMIDEEFGEKIYDYEQDIIRFMILAESRKNYKLGRILAEEVFEIHHKDIEYNENFDINYEHS
jgi:hypothetical protein